HAARPTDAAGARRLSQGRSREVVADHQGGQYQGGVGSIFRPAAARQAIRRNVRLTRNGAPRPMKMGTIASPWRYDAAAETEIKTTITRGGCLGYAQTFGLRRSGVAWHNMPWLAVE